MRSKTHLNKVNQILIFTVVATTDDEYDCILEWSSGFWKGIAALQQLWIQINVIVIVTATIHQLFGDFCHWQVLHERENS